MFLQASIGSAFAGALWLACLESSYVAHPIPLSSEKIVEPRYNELNEPPFLLTHLGNLQ